MATASPTVPSIATAPRFLARVVPWLPPALLLVGLALTAAAWLGLSNRIQKGSEERLTALSKQVELAVVERLQDYIQMLRGAQGLWRSGVPVTRETWRRYVDALALERTYPGIQGLGYAERSDPRSIGELERRIRNEAASSPPAQRAVLEHFGLWPAGTRETYTVIVYLEPPTSRNLRALGFDMHSEQVRTAALDRARDTGEPALSGHVTLVQETDNDRQPGFLVYLPVYSGEPTTVEARRAALRGYVYAPFRAHDLMRNTLAYRGLYVRYSVHDGESLDPDSVLFRSDEPPGAKADAPVARTATVEIAGHRWTLGFRSGPLLDSAADSHMPIAIAMGGTLISLLLAGLARAWVDTRVRAASLAAAMTADLQRRERELEELSTRLASSNEDLQQFAYAASHDLKEPLRSISGSLGLIQNRFGNRLDPQAREFLGYASAGAQRLTSMIDSLLEYSRVNSRAMPLEPVPFEELVAMVRMDLAGLLAESGARLDVGPMPRVMGDRGQLLRVLHNLVGNAIKYSRRRGPPQVSITATRRGDEWVIAVRDNGIGIAPEHQDRLFTMFRRLHSRDEYEGHGIGLALCKRIVQRHGGRIWVESQPGSGSTFCFTLRDASLAAAA